MASAERRLERCRPQQIWDALAEFSCVYVPSGPLEWHGRQNPVGLDALKVEAVWRRAADRTGGLVFPTIFLVRMRSRGRSACRLKRPRFRPTRKQCLSI